MDAAAGRRANMLCGNAAGAVVLELVLQGASFRARRGGWLGVAGAAAGWPPGTARRVEAGEEIAFNRHENGVYAYLAAPGGWDAPQILGSASVSPRAGIGRPLQRGDVLCCLEDPARPMWSGLATRSVPVAPCSWRGEVPCWRGPQWDDFSEETRRIFFSVEWKVTSRSDRMGVRLDGPVLEAPEALMLSEPVLPGAVQVTGRGQPVVTLRDGPTVGGYPKIAWIDDGACRRVAQVPPGGCVKFLPPEP